jgi:alpha-galactosidase
MPHTLESPFLQVIIDDVASIWDVLPQEGRFPPLRGARLAVTYRQGRQRSRAFEHWPTPQVSAPETLASPHGPLRQVSLRLGPEANGLHGILTFAAPESHPLLLWQLTIENTSTAPLFIDQLQLLHSTFDIQSSTSSLPSPAFFSNGWQSWGYTGVYGPTDRFQRTRLGPFTAPMRVNAGTPHPAAPGCFGSDMFGTLGDRSARLGLLVGFLSQMQHFGSLLADLRRPQTPTLQLWANGDGACLDPGVSVATDWACLHYFDLDSPDPLAPYLDAVARQHNLASDSPRLTSAPTGWCSWYHFYQKVTADDIRANLHAASALRASLPIEMIQIDDGFESQVGDWFTFAPGFSAGVAPLAQEIRAAGFTPGLWLAPFIVHPKSRLATDHPDWLLRGRFNRPVNAGFIWDAFTTGLDLTVPEALQYASDVVHTAAHEWGYSFLKLDFLYAAALPGRYRDPTRTRAQALRAGLEALRQAAGSETTLLGCGCPLGSAIGLVEIMRIGPDVNERWRPAYFGLESPFRSEPDMPSARNSIHNALTRLPLHRRWWINDPDCVLLRPATRLTLAEVQTLATVTALTDGSLLFSDHLPDLPPERLQIAEALLPLIGQTPRLLDWFDTPTPARLRLDLENAAGRWHLLALFNWADAPKDILLDLADFGLPQGDYWGRDFWPGRLYRIAGSTLTLKAIPAHGSIALAVRPVIPGRPQYLGSDLHISQGQEVTGWQETPEGLRLELTRPGRSQGQAIISLPQPPRKALLNDRPAEWQPIGEGCYSVTLSFTRRAILHLTT